MQLRRTTIEFRTAFTLTGRDGSWPAGSYVIDVEEARAFGVEASSSRRVATFIHVPLLAHGAKSIEVVQMSAAEVAGAMWSCGSGATH